MRTWTDYTDEVQEVIRVLDLTNSGDVGFDELKGL
jgi:hypothetical protein